MVELVSDAIATARQHGHTTTDQRAAYSLYARRNPDRKLVLELKPGSWPVVRYAATLCVLVKMYRDVAVVSLCSEPRRIVRIKYHHVKCVTDGVSTEEVA